MKIKEIFKRKSKEDDTLGAETMVSPELSKQLRKVSGSKQNRHKKVVNEAAPALSPEQLDQIAEHMKELVDQMHVPADEAAHLALENVPGFERGAPLSVIKKLLQVYNEKYSVKPAKKVVRKKPKSTRPSKDAKLTKGQMKEIVSYMEELMDELHIPAEEAAYLALEEVPGFENARPAAVKPVVKELVRLYNLRNNDLQ